MIAAPWYLQLPIHCPFSVKPERASTFHCDRQRCNWRSTSSRSQSQISVISAHSQHSFHCFHFKLMAYAAAGWAARRRSSLIIWFIRCIPFWWPAMSSITGAYNAYNNAIIGSDCQLKSPTRPMIIFQVSFDKYHWTWWKLMETDGNWWKLMETDWTSF